MPVPFYQCYDYGDDLLLVELLLDTPSDEIDWSAFVVPEEGIVPGNWQAPYLEQYLNPDGTQKLCPLYEEPRPAAKPCRVAFFLYKSSGQTLRTPYGDFDLTRAEPLPPRLTSLVEFEDVD